MDKEKYIKDNFEQSAVNTVWQNVWEGADFNVDKIFSNQLFVEGYRIYEKYIPAGAIEILEAGGGSGRFGLKIARSLPNSNVKIIDIVDSSLNFSKKLSDKLNLKNVSIIKNDILNLSFPDNSFDLIVSDAVIQHVDNDCRGVAEMTRVLKPGGRLVVSVVNFWNFHSLYKFWLRLIGSQYEYQSERAYTKRELRKLFKKNGLKIVAEDGFYTAYGILRLKRRYKIFKLLGRICNRLVKILDKFTNRFFSKNFGFEIVIVGEK